MRKNNGEYRFLHCENGLYGISILLIFACVIIWNNLLLWMSKR